MKLPLVILVGVATLLSGCFAMAGARARAPYLIGCPENEVEVVDERLHTWTYVCHGRRFHCGPNGKQYACSEAMASPAPVMKKRPTAASDRPSGGARGRCSAAELAAMQEQGMSESAIAAACEGR